jgi:Domain of unknown function (DUF1788)
MNDALKERLNKIMDRITSAEFLNNSGLGNEIGFYVFDYPPEYELEVRQHVDFVVEKASKRKPELRIAHINLFQVMIDHLEERGLLGKALVMQKAKGDEAMFKALRGPLHEEKIAKVFASVAQPENNDFVFMTGVGNAYPLLRSHTLLNNLHPLMGGTPLVVFYPGSYDGQGLSLFSKMKDNNYYRAFRLVV